MPQRVDYYEVLGVRRTANLARIRKAYRRLARRLHPDLNPADLLVEEQYRQVQQAFEVLADPDRRAEYDRRGGRAPKPAPRAPSQYGFAGFDFAHDSVRDERPLQELFGGSSDPEPPSETGSDIHARVSISFPEAITGRQVRLRIVRQEACDACGGRGRRPVREALADSGVPCPACGGEGRKLRRFRHMVFVRPCSPCQGRGALFHTRCSGCSGRGLRARPARVVARVPAGISDGGTVVVPGAGHHGVRGAFPGDVRLHVEVKPHPVLERQGGNVTCPLPLTLTEAALGGKVEVPTLSGPVTVRLPPGVQPGTRIRLAGRGVPAVPGGERGDLLLEAQVHIPAIRDDRSRDLLDELAEHYPESPREELRRSLATPDGAGEATA